MTIEFTERHLQIFRDASLDCNPLHLSAGFARQTAAGERVVYGILGVLACLGKVPAPPGKIPAAIRVDFKSTLKLGVAYTLRQKFDAAGQWKAQLLDGSAVMLRTSISFRDGDAECANLPETGVAPLPAARGLKAADFIPGLAFHGSYTPSRAAYLELLELCGVDRKTWGDALLLTLLCTSYLTGMELPGERATYSGLRAEFSAGPLATPADFAMTLASFQEHFGMAQAAFSLSGRNGIFAQGEISALYTPPLSAITSCVGNGRFAGKTALVIGASRGLGAALSLQLAAEGCAVTGVYAQSKDAADTVAQTARGLPGTLCMVQGDASDLAWCAQQKSQLSSLDLLVCNAAPALQSLRVEAAYFGRIQSYLQKGFALVAAPLSSFLELVDASQGSVLLISSSAVERAPAEWPHYVALKGAAEGLLRAAAAAHPKVRFFAARPRKIETGLINTPMGRADAEKPEAVAGRLLTRTREQCAPGIIHLCG